jgi:hypothetical protein
VKDEPYTSSYQQPATVEIVDRHEYALGWSTKPTSDAAGRPPHWLLNGELVAEPWERRGGVIWGSCRRGVYFDIGDQDLLSIGVGQSHFAWVLRFSPCPLFG